MKKKSKREEILDRERKILKETLDIIVQENSELKTELSDIQSNVNENKMQLKQVINSITDKNTAVEILTNQIEQLRQKFYDFQLKQKMQSLLNNNISEDVINSKGNDTNNNNSNNTNNKLMHIKEEEGKNMKEKEEQMKTIEGKIKRQKNFFDNQQEIRNEIINLKRDVNFLQQKINEHKSKFILYQHNCDIQNYFKHNDLNNIKKFLNKSQKDNLIYLVTNSGNVYKIYKREDLSKNNFLNGINLDFISTQRQNEIINIREKIKKDIDSDYYSRKLNLSNNEINENIDIIIHSAINPNYIYDKKAYSFFDHFDASKQIQNEKNSRNIKKQERVNSYVNQLLKDNFVL